MKNLVNLDLSRSFINESWGGWKLIQDLNHLKDLDLSDCENLTRTPEFSENKSLERLVLSRCLNLREIHGSIGRLKSLKYMELFDCNSLGGLPDEIGCLVNLEELNVTCELIINRTLFKLPNSIGCLKSLSKLYLHGFGISDIQDSIGGLTKLKYLSMIKIRAKVLPESLGDLQSLVDLSLTISSVCKLPNSLGRLVNLEKLEVRGGRNLDELLQSLVNLKELKTLSLNKKPVSIGKLKKLEKLHLQCVLGEVPTELCNLPNLRELTMWGSSISTPPSTFRQLKLLETLVLGRNHVLQELPDLPLSLSRLHVSSRSLRKIANLSKLVNLVSLELLGADDYGWWKEIPYDSNCFEGGIEKLIKLEELHLGIATARKILLFDLSSLTLLKRFTLDFQPDQPDLEESDVKPLLLQSTASSSSSPDGLDFTSQGSRLGLKLPDLSSLKNVPKVIFRNCLLKDGLESLGIQQMENVNEVSITNCSAELIELTCLIKNLSTLELFCCESFKTLPNLSKFKNLEALTIFNCEEVVEITCLGSLVSLCKLSIGCCASLEKLNLSKLENISNIFLCDCPKLKTIEGIEELFFLELRLQNCESIKELNNITSLSLESYEDVVEITILGSLVSLRKLDISDCKSLERLEFSKLENLSSLGLWDCPKLRTVEGIEGLFLSELRIYKCGSLQNIGELKKRCTKDADIKMDWDY